MIRMPVEYVCDLCEYPKTVWVRTHNQLLARASINTGGSFVGVHPEDRTAWEALGLHGDSAVLCMNCFEREKAAFRRVSIGV